MHTLHWFPGNFIPQIPRALIQVLSSPGALILDPFVGSGTTAVEAILLGRNVIASDRMSACMMITRGKIAFLNGALDRRRRRALLAELTFDHQCRTDRVGCGGEGGNAELEAWFARETLAQLRFLWQQVEVADSSRAREVLQAIFSDVLFDCASPGAALSANGGRRRHHWGWVADNVRPRLLVPHNAIKLFRQRVLALDDVTALPDEKAAAAVVVKQDARSLALPNESIDLVVTSPPYIGVIDYTHANRLLYSWMGWSIHAEREHEIGARFRRRRVSAPAEYGTNLRQVRDEIVRVLKPGAACAVVLGESRRFPSTAQRILSDFAEVMPTIWGPVPRTPTRRRVAERAARDPVEFVCVFRKP
ncbi:MAG: DNA methyltransferase [Defluviicoccus sp.]